VRDAGEEALRAPDSAGTTVPVRPSAPVARPGLMLPASLLEFPFDTTRAMVNLL